MRSIPSPLQKRHFQGASTGASATTTVRKAAPKPAIARATDLMTEPEDWTADDLQAYVVRKIEELHGPQPDHSHAPRLKSIFGRFHREFGRDAGPIAVWVFETQADAGRWKGAPVKVSRFSKANDEWMARPVLDRIRSAG